MFGPILRLNQLQIYVNFNLFWFWDYFHAIKDPCSHFPIVGYDFGSWPQKPCLAYGNKFRLTAWVSNRGQFKFVQEENV